MEANRNKQGKRKRVRPLRILILAIVLGLLLLALWMGRGLGLLGPGAEEALSGAVQNVEEKLESELDTAQSVLAEETAKRDPNTVLVQEERILYLGNEVDAEALRAALLENYKEGELTLKDDHAIKSVYDEAKAVLIELDISYRED